MVWQDSMSVAFLFVLPAKGWIRYPIKSFMIVLQFGIVRHKHICKETSTGHI